MRLRSFLRGDRNPAFALANDRVIYGGFVERTLVRASIAFPSMR